MNKHLTIEQAIGQFIQSKESEDNTFFRRLEKRKSILSQKLQHLYGNRLHNGFVPKFLNTILDFYNDRSESLRKMDIHREEDPEWFLSNKIVGMMLYNDLFADNLKGVTQKIDYFQELGVNFVHIMPILECPEFNNDGGYAVSNYRNIDPRFGTFKDLEKLISEFKKREMLMALDLVINHTSDEHEWVKKARAGDKHYEDYYYTFGDRSMPDQFEQSLPEVFPETSPGNFTYDEKLGKWVMTVFNSYQWDLNYTNPYVLLETVSNILFLANKGVDMLRLDAVAFVWKKLGTISQNLPEAHTILQIFNDVVQIVCPGLLLLAEAIVPPHELVKYFGTEKTGKSECDVAYNATLMTLLWDAMATKNAKLIKQGVKYLPQKPHNTTFLNYIRCHDDIGLGYDDRHAELAGYDAYLHRKFLVEYLTNQLDWSESSGMPFMYNPRTGDARISGSLASLVGLEKALERNNQEAIEESIQKIVLVHSVMMSYGGIPLLYYGDEIAMLNQYEFLDDPVKKDDNRWVHRPVMDWKKAQNRTKKRSVEYEVFESLKRMIQLRKTISEFSDLNSMHLVDTGNIYLFGYLRFKGQRKTLVICNFNDNEQIINNSVVLQFTWNSNELKDQWTNDAVIFENNELLIKPYSFLWLTDFSEG
ncbi:MAG: alpha-amylase family protein [Bacteroidota bacterium]